MSEENKNDKKFNWKNSTNNRVVKNLIKVKKKDKYRYIKKSQNFNENNTNYAEKYNFDRFSKQENST